MSAFNFRKMKSVLVMYWKASYTAIWARTSSRSQIWVETFLIGWVLYFLLAVIFTPGSYIPPSPLPFIIAHGSYIHSWQLYLFLAVILAPGSCICPRQEYSPLAVKFAHGSYIHPWQLYLSLAVIFAPGRNFHRWQLNSPMAVLFTPADAFLCWQIGHCLVSVDNQDITWYQKCSFLFPT